MKIMSISSCCPQKAQYMRYNHAHEVVEGAQTRVIIASRVAKLFSVPRLYRRVYCKHRPCTHKDILEIDRVSVRQDNTEHGRSIQLASTESRQITFSIGWSIQMQQLVRFIAIEQLNINPQSIKHFIRSYIVNWERFSSASWPGRVSLLRGRG